MFDVLIVGAGPVGLTAGLLLQRMGINAILVDKRNTANTHPKARSLNVRSMEIFRVLGMEPAIREWDFPKEARRVMWLESFCGEELANIAVDHELIARYSPCEPAGLSQARLEEVLRNALNKESVCIQNGAELIDVVEEENCMCATLRKETGETVQMRAKYLLAADGARSTVRKLLKIAAINKEDLGNYVSIYFKANPYPKAPYRPSVAYFILGDASFGRYIHSVNCQDEWLMGIKLTPEMKLDQSDFHQEYCIQFIRETFEVPDLEIKILDIEFWNMRVQIAENFRKGRAFLAGDAAHLLSPAGGYGMQTGIQDVQNLCWKLAAVIQGKMAEDILDTYHAERFPTVMSNMEWSRNNQKGYASIIRAGKSGDRKILQNMIREQWPILNSIGQDIGFCYQSLLVIPDGTKSLAHTSTEYLPNARPGARAPHLWLQGPNGVISAIDLFADSFTLLTDTYGKSWPEVLQRMNPALSFRCICIGLNGDYCDLNQDFHRLYGIERGGAVLVRPDGHVYWRSVTNCLS